MISVSLQCFSHLLICNVFPDLQENTLYAPEVLAVVSEVVFKILGCFQRLMTHLKYLKDKRTFFFLVGFFT